MGPGAATRRPASRRPWELLDQARPAAALRGAAGGRLHLAWEGRAGRAPVALQILPRPRPPGRPVRKPTSCSAARLRLCLGATGKTEAARDPHRPQRPS